MNFTVNPKVSYPALPETDKWISIKQPDRRVLKCGDIYYCIEKSACFNIDGSIANIAPPSAQQIKELRDSGMPPQIHATYEGKNKATIYWRFSENHIRVWKSPHWYNEKLNRFYYGYGSPAPPTPTKN
jgi:hypothetical protein